MEKNFDRHLFRQCVTKSKEIITEKDPFSETARNLLAELLYNTNGNSDSLNISNLEWFDVLKNHNDLVEYRDINEDLFKKIKEFLRKRIDDYRESNPMTKP